MRFAYRKDGTKIYNQSVETEVLTLYRPYIGYKLDSEPMNPGLDNALDSPDFVMLDLSNNWIVFEFPHLRLMDHIDLRATFVGESNVHMVMSFSADSTDGVDGNWYEKDLGMYFNKSLGAFPAAQKAIAKWLKFRTDTNKETHKDQIQYIGLFGRDYSLPLEIWDSLETKQLVNEGDFKFATAYTSADFLSKKKFKIKCIAGVTTTFKLTFESCRYHDYTEFVPDVMSYVKASDYKVKLPILEITLNPGEVSEELWVKCDIPRMKNLGDGWHYYTIFIENKDTKEVVFGSTSSILLQNATVESQLGGAVTPTGASANSVGAPLALTASVPLAGDTKYYGYLADDELYTEEIKYLGWVCLATSAVPHNGGILFASTYDNHHIGALGYWHAKDKYYPVEIKPDLGTVGEWNPYLAMATDPDGITAVIMAYATDNNQLVFIRIENGEYIGINHVEIDAASVVFADKSLMFDGTTTYAVVQVNGIPVFYRSTDFFSTYTEVDMGIDQILYEAPGILVKKDIGYLYCVFARADGYALYATENNGDFWEFRSLTETGLMNFIPAMGIDGSGTLYYPHLHKAGQTVNKLVIMTSLDDGGFFDTAFQSFLTKRKYFIPAVTMVTDDHGMVFIFTNVDNGLTGVDYANRLYIHRIFEGRCYLVYVTDWITTIINDVTVSFADRTFALTAYHGEIEHDGTSVVAFMYSVDGGNTWIMKPTQFVVHGQAPDSLLFQKQVAWMVEVSLENMETVYKLDIFYPAVASYVYLDKIAFFVSGGDKVFITKVDLMQRKVIGHYPLLIKNTTKFGFLASKNGVIYSLGYNVDGDLCISIFLIATMEEWAAVNMRSFGYNTLGGENIDFAVMDEEETYLYMGARHIASGEARLLRIHPDGFIITNYVDISSINPITAVTRDYTFVYLGSTARVYRVFMNPLALGSVVATVGYGHPDGLSDKVTAVMCEYYSKNIYACTNATWVPHEGEPGGGVYLIGFYPNVLHFTEQLPFENPSSILGGGEFVYVLEGAKAGAIPRIAAYDGTNLTPGEIISIPELDNFPGSSKSFSVRIDEGCDGWLGDTRYKINHFIYVIALKPEILAHGGMS